MRSRRPTEQVRKPQTPGLFQTFLQTTPRLITSAPLRIGHVLFRHYSTQEAAVLEAKLRSRTVFARHSWERDHYAIRARDFADVSILFADVPGWLKLTATEIRDLAQRAERLAFLLEASALSREDLHLKMGVSAGHGTKDLLLDATLAHVSTKMRKTRVHTGLEITARTVKRLKRVGLETTAVIILERSTETARRVDRSLAWLEESRLDGFADSAVVKTTIGFETLFGYDKSEPLRRLIGERLAFLLGATVVERVALSNFFRRLYDARSDIVHGGSKKSISVNLDVADRVLLFAAIGIASLAARLPDAEALRNWFDARRWDSSGASPSLPFNQGQVRTLVRRMAATSG